MGDAEAGRLKIAPGDLVLVKYLDLDGGPTAAYSIIAVYDERMYYFHLGKMRVYDAPLSVLEDRGLEVTVLRR